MPFAEIGGLDVYHEIHGAAGPWLVLVHQDGMNSDVWRPLLPNLMRHFRVALIDRVAHGRSGTPPEQPPYSVAQGATWLGQLVEALRIERPIFFGASGGALMALAFALRYPDKTPLLILAEPPLHGLRQHFPIEREGFSADNFAAILRRDGAEAMARAFLGSMFSPPRVQAILRSPSGRAMLQLAPHVLCQAIQANEQYAPGAELHRLGCPVVLLTGARSGALFHSIERVLAAQLPRCLALQVRDADHANLLSPTPWLETVLVGVSRAMSADDPWQALRACPVGSRE